MKEKRVTSLNQRINFADFSFNHWSTRNLDYTNKEAVGELSLHTSWLLTTEVTKSAGSHNFWRRDFA